jgi:FkbM family methyltransferase
MDSKALANYFVSNRDEFYGEDGHDKLLVGLKKFTRPLGNKIKVVGIDVGCCVGEYTSHIQEICSESNAQILCFEPNPINIIEIETKFKDNHHVKLFKMCVSNETTIASLHNWKDNVENTKGNGVGGLRSGGPKICDVEVNTLDNILNGEFLNEDIVIKFIKIDTEGNDTNVLRGFGKYLPYTKYIVFECSDCLYDFRGPGTENPMKDIVDFLSDKGFDTYRIGTKKLIKVNDEHWDPIYEKVNFWANCFAVKKDDSIIYALIDEDFNYKF